MENKGQQYVEMTKSQIIEMVEQINDRKYLDYIYTLLKEMQQ